MTKWELHTWLLLHYKHEGCLEEKHSENQAMSYLACFFMEQRFYLKECPTEYGYSIWQIFSSRWMKWAHLFKEIILAVFVANAKMGISKKNRNFGKLVSLTGDWTASFSMPKDCLMRSMVIITSVFFYTVQWNLNIWKIYRT